MRSLNTAGNKFFSWVFSWLLEQPIKDTLCGTKAMFRDDYNRLQALRLSIQIYHSHLVKHCIL